MFLFAPYPPWLSSVPTPMPQWSYTAWVKPSQVFCPKSQPHPFHCTRPFSSSHSPYPKQNPLLSPVNLLLSEILCFCQRPPLPAAPQGLTLVLLCPVLL